MLVTGHGFSVRTVEHISETTCVGAVVGILIL